MSDTIQNLQQEPVPSQDEATAQSDVFVIPRTVFNNVVIATVFFILGGLAAALLIDNSARSTEQVINQAVAVAINSFADTQGDRPVPSLNNAGTRLEVSPDDDPSHGPADAPVTIVEFSDFNCPYCARFVRETLPLLRENYGDRIRFVYRDFAILGPTSVDAAVASECANEQSGFWAYHDLLFANQGIFGRDRLIDYAQQAELNIEEFTACLSDTATRDEVLADTTEAQRLGATGTPTFFINGRPLIGAQPFATFAAMIDEELATAGNNP
ncbi:DsbA family protein [Kamptonema cortianum]|jgi:protein-disulfide isomerase|nr:DsbA family protein [Kamptonema cortianum]